jgi:hypothetical protein
MKTIFVSGLQGRKFMLDDLRSGLQCRSVPNRTYLQEGPGNIADEIAAVERNDKAVALLMAAMPDAQAVTLLVAGKANPNWPNCPKVH